ncbi:hypothetical protein K458DRAFT_299560 [Lentithecium fluviatile CBS 122367]|uniref:Membrane-associated proteins in eicosanoid and glutathione metabolism n=1 Tax=Lentithecium fluviatile CBS 122367 TaxID=1168545 RepID=A0A6G1J704_9PLEO|nr:hypothetical protein K458DRAFT_299560 [Lentithecium fluviatile CBS 122367]
MSFPTSRIGLNLTHATATWAAPFATYYLFLQNRIVFHRLSNKKYIGDTTDPSKGTTDPLYVSTRAQLSFIENVPFAMLLALLVELNGAERKYINYALGTLLALRISHVELGLMAKDNLGKGRILGYYGTQVIMASLAGYTAYLVSNY